MLAGIEEGRVDSSEEGGAVHSAAWSNYTE